MMYMNGIDIDVYMMIYKTVEWILDEYVIENSDKNWILIL